MTEREYQDYLSRLNGNGNNIVEFKVSDLIEFLNRYSDCEDCPYNDDVKQDFDLCDTGVI